MQIIPAVDIKNGKCVRLLQGRMDAETVFSDDPSAMAKKWEDEGARIIHVVDLDGAVKKEPQNTDSIKQIIKKVKADIQIGGGIRNLETIEKYISIGVKRVVIGTEAIINPKFVKEACKLYPGHIAVGIDAKEGYVAIDGWTKTTKVKAIDLAKEFENSGVSVIIFTDIYRDGMQTGINVDETRKIKEAISIPVIASGGVSNIDDILHLIPLYKIGVIGVIVGRALYSNSLNLSYAISIVETHGRASLHI
ncbi:MAG: 1-(5-phosphoribosyl)-5-[(5-phosphoribosylamino)methylideneamino]imidazole-4-carboxamide isomerase [Desulfobacterales bacterium]|nr:1-(5-phosphoribosyl)-5-[(5-phosphoribosylamino)methylideneamino]imidazole-4-carboxamide isomerase [Desulfobacterales bacterium]MBF0395338.1 1-(5-phosphoribosyl)-5-[(5-phosphoribosylamino)methylideneamino]imidazole-4-carboxamide isomerase [Desulfobacterales bacterium]